MQASREEFITNGQSINLFVDMSYEERVHPMSVEEEEIHALYYGNPNEESEACAS